MENPHIVGYELECDQCAKQFMAGVDNVQRSDRDNDVKESLHFTEIEANFKALPRRFRNTMFERGGEYDFSSGSSDEGQLPIYDEEAFWVCSECFEENYDAQTHTIDNGNVCGDCGKTFCANTDIRP